MVPTVEGLRSPPIVPRTAKEENHVEFSEDAFWRTWKPPADIATYNGKTGLNTAVTQQKNTNNSVLSGQALLSGHPALMLRHHQRGSTLRQHGTLGRRAIAWNTYESPKQVSTKGILEGQQRTTGHGTASVGKLLLCATPYASETRDKWFCVFSYHCYCVWQFISR